MFKIKSPITSEPKHVILTVVSKCQYSLNRVEFECKTYPILKHRKEDNGLAALIWPSCLLWLKDWSTLFIRKIIIVTWHIVPPFILHLVCFIDVSLKSNKDKDGTTCKSRIFSLKNLYLIENSSCERNLLSFNQILIIKKLKLVKISNCGSNLLISDQ